MPKKIFSEKAASSKNVLIDNMLVEAFDEVKTDEKATIGDSLANQPIVFYETDGIVFPQEEFETYQGNQYLISFFEKLYQLEIEQKGNVRIAYYGDSMTDGDMIVQDFRSNMQQRYGGKGVGFVAISSESAASRSSITHEFSENWKTQSYLNVKYPLRPFGINGHVFFNNDSISKSWVKYTAGRRKNATQLDSPTLFYGNSNNKNGEIFYKIGRDTLYKKLVPNNTLNTIVLSNSSIKSLKVDFQKTKSVPIYGFNFDDGKGVHVDNFSQRGNSGIPISKFNIDLMRSFQKKLDYDLIILHYGTNVLNYGTKNYNWYERSMNKTVNRLKECFPDVSILVISTADKATKYEMEMKTDSAVVPLSTAQKRLAIRSKTGFVNLFSLMGGAGSMRKWAEEQPILANKDYTHFNYQGSKKIADLLSAQLLQGYEKYKKLRQNRNQNADSEVVKEDSISSKKLMTDEK